MFFQIYNRLFSVLSGQPSLIEELWDFYKDKYFTPDYGEYHYLDVGGNSMVSLTTIVIAFIIGIVLASAAAIFNKRVLGDFVRSLLLDEAHSPESAKTLEQLGYLKNTTIRSALKRGTTLRRVVRCVEEDEYLEELERARQRFEENRTDTRQKFKETPFVMDVSTAHFYIPEELRYTADIKFEQKGTNWLVFLGVVIGAIAMGVLVIWLMPQLLQMLDNFIGMFAG